MLEFVLDWYLIYRNVEQGAGVIPESIPADARNIKVDSTGRKYIHRSEKTT